MSVSNVLPDMDEPRMKYLGNQLNRSRKTSMIMHGKMKSSLDIYVKSVNKSEKRERGKYQLNGMRLKRRLSRVRGTQKVMKGRRESSFMRHPDLEFPYGVYEGERLDSYRREVDGIIERKHPKYRRQKEVEHHLKDGKRNGRILDNTIAKLEFEEIMTLGQRSKIHRNSNLHRENPLSQTFLHDTNRYYNSSKPHGKTGIYLSTGKLTPLTPRSSGTPVTPGTPMGLKNRRSRTPDSVESAGVTLPALTVNKDFVQNKSKPPTKFVLPSLGVRRATKCSALSEPRYQVQELSKLKDRRATTFM